MEPLQHDPKSKQQIKEALYAHLYAPVQMRFKNRIDALVVQNTLIGGYAHKSFQHKGVLYAYDTSPPPRKANRLVPQLTVPMADYLRDLQVLNEQELPYVLGFINAVLNASNHFPDYLHLFPEALHAPLYQLLTTCPCHTRQLDDPAIAALKAKNTTSIDLMKARLVLNLIV